MASFFVQMVIMEKKALYILSKYYNIVQPKIKKLDGYESINYCVKTKDGIKYILKLHLGHDEDKSEIEGENQMLHLLNDKLDYDFSCPIESNIRETVIEFESRAFARLLSFVEGEFLGEIDHTNKVLISLGRLLAKIDRVLLNENNFSIKGRRLKWDNQYALDSEPYLNYIKNPSKRKLLEYYFLQFKEKVIPKMPYLRKSIIHNDANDWNVLIQEGEVSGIIDLGDMCYTHLINELAVALPYVLIGKEEPLEKACLLIKSYHEILPLEAKELGVLYYLIAIRLCISVCNSAYHSKQNPENEEYITISEKGAWALLEKWIGINPKNAEKKFKLACGINIEKENNVQDDLRKRHLFMSKSMSVSYNVPIKLESAAFQYMYPSSGNTILDAYNNIPIVGHCHPKVVAAGQRQMAKLNTNTRYIYDILNEYSEKLLNTFPKKLNKVFFVNSGSAASDLAIRLANVHTGKNKIGVLEHGYHGNTMIGIDISSYKFDGKGGEGRKGNILKLAMPDVYRGKFNGEERNSGKSYAKEAIDLLKKSEEKISAIIAEPIMGCGGQVVLPKGYLKEVFRYVENENGVCIVDEVQIGFGRVGTHFWGFEQHGIVPDIVILGKPMGNGHPIGAVVCTDEIAESFENGMEFFSSFGGNPVSCTIGLSVLEVLEEEGLQQNSLEVGNYIMDELRGLQNKYPIIGDVRGSGLFWGMEMVEDPRNKMPATKKANDLKNYLRMNNILVGTDGPFDNVIKSKPPLCFNMENADQLLESTHDWLKINRAGKG